jgi:AcrR family transcriptional regulator
VAEDNQRKILDFAVAAIDAGGEAAIRVHDIAAQAGISVPVVYHYFGNREGLVVAAQVERYTRQTRTDIDAMRRAVATCDTSAELREALRITWERSLSQRATNRWRRISVLGSAYVRRDLEIAIARAQDEIVASIATILEPCRERGWLRSGIDLTSTLAWHHSILLSRVFIERGALEVDSSEWDRLTLDALDRAFFNS